MRLDQQLAQTVFSSRSRAKDAIQEGRVSVNGKIITKCSFDVSDQDDIAVADKENDFVSRAGQKMFDVLDEFEISLQDKCVLDVGASTGGFSDVCLKKGARLVYALDVGHDQLHESLKKNPRCINMEGRNVREMTKEWFSQTVDFVCMDVSFLSCLTALTAVQKVFPDALALILVKPQFEAGPDCLNKHGIVKDDNVLIRVLRETCEQATKMGYTVRRLKESSIQGRDGNREFLMYLTKEEKQYTHDYRAIVKNNKKRCVESGH